MLMINEEYNIIFSLDGEKTKLKDILEHYEDTRTLFQSRWSPIYQQQDFLDMNREVPTSEELKTAEWKGSRGQLLTQIYVDFESPMFANKIYKQYIWESKQTLGKCKTGLIVKLSHKSDLSLLPSLPPPSPCC